MIRTIPARLLITLSLAAAAVAACTSVGRAVGSAKVAPDEFRVVTKAPLVLPPEYNVRPPKPGEPRPQELAPSEQARRAVLGQEYARRASDGEQLLVAKAGGAEADPVIRQRVDIEAGGVARKPEDFANLLLFWRASEAGGGVLDAEAEARRLRLITAVTGEDEEVVIDRRTGLKLPGL